MRLAGHHADAHVFQCGRGAEAFGDVKRLNHAGIRRSRRNIRRVHGLAHLTVLPHRFLSSTFAFVTSGAGNWSSSMPGAQLDDRAAVIGRARLEGLSGERGLDVEQAVFRVQISGLRNGGVDFAAGGSRRIPAECRRC